MIGLQVKKTDTGEETKNKQAAAMRKVKQNGGGSAWESNPPKTFLMPPNGVEVRGAHRDSSAPSLEANQVYSTNLMSAITASLDPSRQPKAGVLTSLIILPI